MQSIFTAENRMPRMFEDVTAPDGKVGFVRSLFGCWHGNLSRPFTHGKNSYRVCLKCGAQRKFDPETLKTSGAFYYPPPARRN